MDGMRLSCSSLSNAGKTEGLRLKSEHFSIQPTAFILPIPLFSRFTAVEIPVANR